MASVLVTDGEERAALAVVRSLGRAGHHVHVCSKYRRCLAGSSRYASESAVVPDPLEAPRDYVGAVRQLATARGVELLLPISEASLLPILDERRSFGGIHIPWPSHERFTAICDKSRVLQEAERIGIRVPEQQQLQTPAAREQLDYATLTFPVVIKPARSVGEANGRRAKLGVLHASNASALDASLRNLPSFAYPVLIQQRIRGPGIGVFLLLWDGAVVATFSHQRIREKPPSGGVSVYRESTPTDPQLVALSRSLLAAFDWQGVAMVEYKLDEARQVPYLMEINGRFWGSLQLAVDAGVDFPSLLVDAALGASPQPVGAYRIGVRSRWWWGDVDHLWARLRRSRAMLGLESDAPGRGRAALDFLTLWRPGDRSEILRVTDPLPFFRETLDWFARR